jgi:hypothetical protein
VLASHRQFRKNLYFSLFHSFGVHKSQTSFVGGGGGRGREFALKMQNSISLYLIGNSEDEKEENSPRLVWQKWALFIPHLALAVAHVENCAIIFHKSSGGTRGGSIRHEIRAGEPFDVSLAIIKLIFAQQIALCVVGPDLGLHMMIEKSFSCTMRDEPSLEGYRKRGGALSFENVVSR